MNKTMFKLYAKCIIRNSYCYPKLIGRHVIQRKLSSKSSYEVNLNINGVSLNKYLFKLTEEYEVLKKSSVQNGRITELEPIINILQDREGIVNNISNLEDLLTEKDDDLQNLAVQEKESFENQIRDIDKKLEESILNLGKVEQYDSIVLEVNAGVGGQEAMLFAKELFEMYSGFVEYKGWTYYVAEYLTTDIGGIRHATMFIDGKNVFQYFKYEAGVHRVQRIPATEKAGRLHTSTVSVLVLPQPSDIEINLRNSDLRIDTKRATGAGGQHVNTTDSAVRITHIPTGLSVECQTDRSQIKNRQVAMQRLKAKLYQLEIDKQQSEISATRKSQVKSNFRNEKIRTYNFSQDRITDHRLQSSNMHNLKTFMLGNEMLGSLIDKLYTNDRIERLLNLVREK